MTTKAIRQHLVRRVTGSTGRLTVGGGAESVRVPVVPPNRVSNASPRVEVSIPEVSQSGGTLAGNERKVEAGTMLAVVVNNVKGRGTGFMYSTADAVVDLFTEGSVSGLNISGTDIPYLTTCRHPDTDEEYECVNKALHTAVQITARPSVGGLYRDEGELRLPVTIQYRASGRAS